MLSSETYYGAGFAVAASTLAAMAAAAWLAWRKRRKLAPQPVRVDECRRVVRRRR